MVLQYLSTYTCTYYKVHVCVVNKLQSVLYR
jgi:hypothetical protein